GSFTPPQRRQQHLEKRQALIRNARVLFNRKGFDAVSIDEIMASAGLTRGGFYSYFTSKGELYALAVGGLLAEGHQLAAPDAARQLIGAYLSQQHPGAAEGGCSLISLPVPIARADATVARVFESGFRRMAALFELSLQGETRSHRDRALLMATLCVGAMA